MRDRLVGPPLASPDDPEDIAYPLLGYLINIPACIRRAHKWGLYKSLGDEFNPEDVSQNTREEVMSGVRAVIFAVIRAADIPGLQLQTAWLAEDEISHIWSFPPEYLIWDLKQDVRRMCKLADFLQLVGDLAVIDHPEKLPKLWSSMDYPCPKYFKGKPIDSELLPYLLPQTLPPLYERNRYEARHEAPQLPMSAHDSQQSDFASAAPDSTRSLAPVPVSI
ncbi:hypothetical protein FISHEDRAFT_69914 [Fistulina hepatica ATCC 64428]|uniref:Uncharacterized protein n=1 Tax=Fistulina hepatica ATCC 64428 TaxID=1128425 RepID=A0A0D7AL64_9AGAR|nr:hypothetical protein FISHEDRAFT_69914 [Fistulina hepatica ATCC 64428]